MNFQKLERLSCSSVIYFGLAKDGASWPGGLGWKPFFEQFLVGSFLLQVFSEKSSLRHVNSMP